jgi:endonuclease YncB( thermonuclease family)
MRRIAFILVALLLHAPAWAQKGAPDHVFTAKVERTTDGDTVVFPQGVCRLLGIDAPEKAQPLGPEAWRTLAELLGDRPVLAMAWGKDRYGRMLCLILAEDGYLANMTLVESGLALVYMAERLFLQDGLEAAQARAKADRRGVWGLKSFEEPWKYRARIRGQR